MIWRFSGIRSVPVQGRFWRMLSPRWSFDPLSGKGAARAGGRWNEEGQLALYLSEDYGTAIAEYHQDVPKPGTLTCYEVTATAHSLLDLTDSAVHRTLGLDKDLLRRDWKNERYVEHVRPASWDFARAAADEGWHGLRVPSAQTPGNNLVFWRWNEAGTPTIRIIDLHADLPKDQTSWSV